MIPNSRAQWIASGRRHSLDPEEVFDGVSMH
jgi:hypothetical protein